MVRHWDRGEDDFVLTAIDRVDTGLDLAAIGAGIPVVELYRR